MAHPTPPAEEPWSSGLFACFSDVPNCCLTCFCPCVTFGQIAEIVDKGATSCGVSGAMYAIVEVVSGCGFVLSCYYRKKLRRQYMIGGNDCCDCAAHAFCECCALCQEYRQLRHRGFDMQLGWNGGVVGNQNQQVVTTAPVALDGMQR